MTSRRSDAANQRGVALIVALLCMLLMSALGTALVMLTITELGISSTFARGVEAFHAADAALERVAIELGAVDDWNAVLNGTAAPAFSDGPSDGTYTITGDFTIDLQASTNLVRCGTRAPCGDLDLDKSTQDRPWGADNPRWRLYAYGPAAAVLAPAAFTSPVYVLVWVGDDPEEHDGRPLEDGGPNVDGTRNAGRDVVAVLAHS